MKRRHSQPPADPTRLSFAETTWQCKAGLQLGPGPNDWAADQAWVDKQGRMHLRISKNAVGKWQCGEVISDESFGYGEYRFTFSGQLNELDPNIVLGLFTYLDDANEIDFELAQWGHSADQKNAQFVVQPAANERIFRFATGSLSRLTVTLVWTRTCVQWQCWNGTGSLGDRPMAMWTFTGTGIPEPSVEKLHMNLWLLRGRPLENESPAEVLIESFIFHGMQT